MRSLQERARDLLARHEAERLALIEDALGELGHDFDIERAAGEIRVRGRGLKRAMLNPAELRFLMERAR